MIKIISKYIKSLFVLLIVITFVYNGKLRADSDDKRKSRISDRDKFTSKTQFKRSGNGFNEGGETNSKGDPPNPDDGGDGWPVPISDGVSIILLGGAAYYLLKKKLLKNKNQV